MNFYSFLNLVKGLDVNVFDSGLNIWFDPDYDHSAFFDWCSNKLNFFGFDEVNGHYGECYFLCFECTNCGDPFCS